MGGFPWIRHCRSFLFCTTAFVPFINIRQYILLIFRRFALRKNNCACGFSYVKTYVMKAFAKATYKQALILLYKVSASWKGSKQQNCSRTCYAWKLASSFILYYCKGFPLRTIETAKHTTIRSTKLAKRLFQSVELKYAIGNQRILQMVSCFYQESLPGKITLASVLLASTPFFWA